MVQEGVDFDRALGAAAGGPGEGGEAQLHHGGVQAGEFMVKLALMPGRRRLAALGEAAAQGLEKGGRPRGMGVGKGGAGPGLNAQMIETAGPGLEPGNAVPEAPPAGELHEEQVHELLPAGKGAGWPTGAVVLLQGGNMMSRN
jgi:hypothetical protein